MKQTAVFVMSSPTFSTKRWSSNYESSLKKPKAVGAKVPDIWRTFAATSPANSFGSGWNL